MSVFGADGVPCMLMRGGTSKGAYFLADDLPADDATRDDFLLRVMGSPDARQVDGIGGGHPLTSKVAIVAPSNAAGIDVDYLFLQVQVDKPLVSGNQTCGNLLAGVAPFAIERGLVSPTGDLTRVTIRTLNPSGGVTVARVETPGGRVRYDGDTVIAGAAFPAATIPLEFPASEAELLPTGRVRDVFDGLEVTCVDAGMPVVLLRARDLGLTGSEAPDDLEGDVELKSRLESIRLQAGRAMGLGEVAEDTVPKMSIVSAPAGDSGSIGTRTFIPHRVHAAIGVVGAVSVAAGSVLAGSVAEGLVAHDGSSPAFRIEHPSGFVDVEIELADGPRPTLTRSAVVRTARKLFDGVVWPRIT